LLYEIGYSDSILNIIYLSIQNKRIVAIFIDETQIKIGSIEETWLWVAIEPSLHRKILGVYIIKIRNMLVTEAFLRSRLFNFMLNT
jgi:transposase-like protein